MDKRRYRKSGVKRLIPCPICSSTAEFVEDERYFEDYEGLRWHLNIQHGSSQKLELIIRLLKDARKQ